jgi:hypothetical protein
MNGRAGVLAGPLPDAAVDGIGPRRRTTGVVRRRGHDWGAGVRGGPQRAAAYASRICSEIRPRSLTW